MARTLCDSDREDLIELVVNHILETGDSYRKTASFLSEKGKKISHVTVKDYCDRYIASFGENYKVLEAIISFNTAKGIEDEKVLKRVIQIAKVYTETDSDIEDIAEDLDLSFQTVYNDLHLRLPDIASEEAVNLSLKVKEKCEKNSLDNLRNRNGR